MSARKSLVWRVVAGSAALSAVAWFVVAGPSGATGGSSVPETPPPAGAVVSVVTSPFGQVLVGTLDGIPGFPLYEISSDKPPKFGCVTTVETSLFGTFPCTGPLPATPAVTPTSEWPAFTTTGPITAGRGVQGRLLGTVYRPGVGDQVTYKGHPLYLFSFPGTYTGEGFVETAPPLPPWHGIWDLVLARTGNPAVGRATLEVGRLTNDSPVLAVKQFLDLPTTFPTGLALTVYDFCPGVPRHGLHPTPCTHPGRGPDASPVPGSPGCGPGCTTTIWAPVLTDGPPIAGPSVTPGSLGTVQTPGGLQVTYDGRPLYAYGLEEPLVGTFGPRTTGTAGNGAGERGPGGFAHLIPLAGPLLTPREGTAFGPAVSRGARPFGR